MTAADPPRHAPAGLRPRPAPPPALRPDPPRTALPADTAATRRARATLATLWRRLWLNARVIRLAACRRWLDRGAVACAYDRVAPDYDDAWQCHLRPVTDDLLSRLPALPRGRIMDLGCGTGYATGILAARHPDAPLAGVDISPRMLEEARRRVTRGAVEFAVADMLAWMAAQPSRSAALVFSAWAIGYSDPARVLAESARVLVPGGVLAFVVNYADTLAPVFRAYRHCMTLHPGQVRLAAWLKFPSCWRRLEGSLARGGFHIAWHADGRQPIVPPAPAGGAVLPWLLKTGVLAGFDAMLPLAAPGPVSEHFETLLRQNPGPLEHHYAAAVACRP
ncbi:MAG: class I SAM-dependent methyltransferase [Verrucomicrobia bacterium]|nr:class I SAM-dependent methyltransferase [Verrucomicrobiota bacterium]